MTVRVVLPRMLADVAGGATELAIEWEGTLPLGALIAEIGAAHPALERRIVDETGSLRRHANVYVDGEECRRLAGLATPVSDGAEIHVIGSIAGG